MPTALVASHRDILTGKKTSRNNTKGAREDREFKGKVSDEDTIVTTSTGFAGYKPGQTVLKKYVTMTRRGRTSVPIRVPIESVCPKARGYQILLDEVSRIKNLEAQARRAAGKAAKDSSARTAATRAAGRDKKEDIHTY